MATIKENNEIELDKYIKYDEETNIAKCLVPECKQLCEKNEFAVKLHYQKVHEIYIEDGGGCNEELTEIHNMNTQNSYSEWDGEPIKTLADNVNGKNNSNIILNKNKQDKGYRNFLVADYVEYCKKTDISKCLIRNCERLMSGHRTGNIKRHYHKVHNFVIVHENCKSNEGNEGVSDVLKQQSPIIVNMDKYCKYDPILDKSVCKMPGCYTALSGKIPRNILRHYNWVHNYKIKTIAVTDENNVKQEHRNNMEPVTNTFIVPVEDLVFPDIKTSTDRCLFINCNHTLEKDFTNVNKHYYDTHKIIIAKESGNIPNRFYRKRQYRYIYENNLQNEEDLASGQEISAKMDPIYIKNELLIENAVPHCSYNIYETDDVSKILKRKIGRKFPAKNYVQYCKNTNVSKCLIRNCKRLLCGQMCNNIKRHYHKVHNLVIMHGISGKELTKNKREQIGIKLSYFALYDKETSSYKCLFINCNSNLVKDVNSIKNHYQVMHNIIVVRNCYENKWGRKRIRYNEGFKEVQEFKKETNDIDKLSSSKSFTKPRKDNKTIWGKRRYKTFIIDNYVDYCKETNISKCLIKYCQRCMSGRVVGNIKRHYDKVHNLNIGGNITLNDNENEETSEVLLQHLNINLDDLVVHDVRSDSFQCLFINCNEILEKDMITIQSHYKKVHKALLITDANYFVHRKRRFNELHQFNEWKFPDDYENDEDDESCSIRNEVLSDEELPTKRAKIESFFIKKEYIDDHESLYCENSAISMDDTRTVISCKEKLFNVEISFNKNTFLKLCLGLIIQRDLCLSLFDDEEYFKALLKPYEHVFDCHLDSRYMIDLILKASNIIISDLKETFSNKIVCLELHVLSREQKYYLIINVRFVEEQILCNKLIGFLSITEDTEILWLSEFLSKFNIDKQQVYMTTLLAGVQDDEEIYKICDKIYKHNPDIKHHPIYDIYTKLRSFLEKYSEDIKCWYDVSNFKKKSADVLTTLKEFASYMENLTETDIDLKPQLKEAKYFLKSLKIFRNCIEKLSGEHYVAGDFYRDLLCCELEMKSESTKNNNSYAGKLYEELANFKNSLLENSEFLAALYLDPRFNFLGSRLLSDAQKIKGKLCLCSIWEKFNKYLQSGDTNTDPLLLSSDLNNDDPNDDEYALLNEHINETMPLKSSVCIEDKLSNCVPAKREPFSLDILKYWHCNRQNIKDINELTKIAFTFSSSQYMLTYLQRDFTAPNKDTKKFDKFLIKNNQNILEKNIDLIFEDLK